MYIQLFIYVLIFKVNISNDDIVKAGNKQITTLTFNLDSNKFREIKELTIFVQSNVSEGDVTEINTIRFTGVPKNSMKLEDLFELIN